MMNVLVKVGTLFLVNGFIETNKFTTISDNALDNARVTKIENSRITYIVETFQGLEQYTIDKEIFAYHIRANNFKGFITFE